MSDLERFFSIAEAMAKLLYPYAEVVVHNVTTNRIAAIYNNFSQREVGDDSLLDDLHGLEKGPSVHGPFLKDAPDGRPLKYTSMVLRDDAQKVVGLMCVNIDLGPWTALNGQLRQFLEVTTNSAKLDALFEDDWQERLKIFVQRFLRERHLTLATLARADRMQLVGSLQNAGAFRAKNAMGFAARIIGVSRATIYNDLAQIESKPDESES